MRAIASLIIIFAMLVAPGCGDDPAAPLSGGLLIGTVVDTNGDPIADASITLVFGVDGVGLPGWDPLLRRARTTVHFAIASDSWVRVGIENFLGRPVKELLQGQLEAGDYELEWNADDEEGDLVPPGLYRIVLEAWPDRDAEPLLSRQPVLLYETDLRALAQRAHAHTDADGHFTIPLAIAPVGETLGMINEDGETGEWTISSKVKIVVAKDLGHVMPTQTKELVLVDPERVHRVDFELSLQIPPNAK